jgi:very-short-patch-repair endonuclease
MISWMLTVGRLHPKHRGVYAVGHLAPVELGDETAALLACGDTAVLSHQTAAAVWGILSSSPPGAPVHITAAKGQRGKGRPGIRAHRTRQLGHEDVRIKAGLPITSPARTLLDLARTEAERTVERALDEALVQGIVRVPEIAAIVGRYPRRREGRMLARLIERRVGPTITRSEAEERFLALVRAAGLPEPEINVRLHGYEVDFFWRAQKVVVEVDGYRYHSSRTAMNRDRRKDAALKAAGVDVNRVTWDQMDVEPYAVIARTATALALPGAAA